MSVENNDNSLMSAHVIIANPHNSSVLRSSQNPREIPSMFFGTGRLAEMGLFQFHSLAGFNK